MNTRTVMKGLFVSGALLALLIGCSTSVEGVDEGDVLSTQQALRNDPCLVDLTDPQCDSFGDPAPTPTAPGGAVINTTYWRIEHAGWQLSVSAPIPSGSGSITDPAYDTLKATATMVRTSSANASLTGRGFGAAIVRQVPKPGGTIASTCTANAQCWPNLAIETLADDSYYYCVKVGTATSKTCVQRVGGNPSWAMRVTPATSFAQPGTLSFPVPTGSNAPYGNAMTVGGADKYSTMAVLNVVGQVPTGRSNPDGSAEMAPPCSLGTVNSPNGIPYEEDPAYCVKMVRPAVTLTKWKCGDGVCNGTEDVATCAGDCHCGDGVCNYGESSSTCGEDCCSRSQIWCAKYGINDPECMACGF